MKNSFKKYSKQACSVLTVCILILSGCDSVTNADKVTSTVESATITDLAAKGGKWIHNVTGWARTSIQVRQVMQHLKLHSMQKKMLMEML